MLCEGAASVMGSEVADLCARALVQEPHLWPPSQVAALVERPCWIPLSRNRCAFSHPFEVEAQGRRFTERVHQINEGSIELIACAWQADDDPSSFRTP
jgi:hypothetical protein